jgi:hypothetical protein
VTADELLAALTEAGRELGVTATAASGAGHTPASASYRRVLASAPQSLRDEVSRARITGHTRPDREQLIRIQVRLTHSLPGQQCLRYE